MSRTSYYRLDGEIQYFGASTRRWQAHRSMGFQPKEQQMKAKENTIQIFVQSELGLGKRLLVEHIVKALEPFLAKNPPIKITVMTTEGDLYCYGAVNKEYESPPKKSGFRIIMPSCKWYFISLYRSDRSDQAVFSIGFTELEHIAAELKVSPYVDHCPNPRVLEIWAERAGHELPEEELEKVTGRWIREGNRDPWAREDYHQNDFGK